MSSISDFVGKFQHGSRANLFRVEIGYLGEDFKFYCKSAQFPGHSIDKIPVYYQNKKVYVAGDKEFNDWTITVLNDNDHSIREYLEMWSDKIMDRASINGASRHVNYTKTCTIFQLDQNENETAEYELEYAWPTDLSPIEVGYDTQDTVQEYNVTFSYAYYKKKSSIGDMISGMFGEVVRDATSIL